MESTQIFMLLVDAVLLVFLIIEISHKLFGIVPPGIKKIENSKK